MRRQPSEKIEGFILLDDVLGKSGRPIMKKNTVLTNEHITVLKKFLIDDVSVGPNQMEKTVEEPKKEKRQVKQQEVSFAVTENKKTFYDEYIQAVSQFKKEYQQWHNGVPIDIAKVRKIIIPLLEQVESLQIEPFHLHYFSNAKEYIYYHSTAISILSAFLASKLGYEKGEYLQIGIAALLSDIGMTKVDQDILNKGAPLTTKQLQEIHQHPIYSHQMIEKLPTITVKGLQAILQHHERIDGSGYPAGLKGLNIINPYAQIIAVCDTYYAMIGARLYKKEKTIFQAVEELYKEKYTKLDGEIVGKFINVLTKQSIGRTVRLSDQSVGEIVYIDEDNPTQILIKLDETEEVISLKSYSELFIEKHLN